MNETLPKLVLTPDAPAFIELCFDTPKEGDNTNDDGTTRHWWMFQVKDENESRFKYFPPPPIAPVMCLASKGATFTLIESAKIVDGKPRKITNIYEGWVDIATATPIPLAVERKQPPPQTAPTTPPVSRTAPPQKAPPAPPTAPSQSRTTPPTKHTVRLADVANTMEACIIAAGNIAAAWPEEQQQAVAVSMFISLDKAGSYLTREQVKATAAFYAGGVPEDATKHGGEDDGSVDYEPPPDEEDMFSDEPAGEEGLPF